MPKWSQVDTKMGSTINVDFERRFFKYRALAAAGAEDLGVQVGSIQRPTIDPKMESKTECILASIFERFWWILGAKLGWKIDPTWLIWRGVAW